MRDADNDVNEEKGKECEQSRSMLPISSSEHLFYPGPIRINHMKGQQREKFENREEKGWMEECEQ